MIISLHKHKDEKEVRLEKFAKEQWQKTRLYLQGRYSLTEDECADVFQDSLIILWRNINENKVEADSLGMSSSTYFMSICRNKTMELLRSKSKYIITSYEINPSKEHYDYQEEQVEKILSMDDDYENAQKEKEALVRDIVKNLPSPCNELLWGYYGDGHSMKMLAEMFNYASENAVKVTKHRCCEKFRMKYNEMSKSLF
jgi:RNA polymerase sigma factor (sigma-70 family)